MEAGAIEDHHGSEMFTKVPYDLCLRMDGVLCEEQRREGVDTSVEQVLNKGTSRMRTDMHGTCDNFTQVHVNGLSVISSSGSCVG